MCGTAEAWVIQSESSLHHVQESVVNRTVFHQAFKYVCSTGVGFTLSSFRASSSGLKPIAKPSNCV